MTREEMTALLGDLNSVWGTSGHEQMVGDEISRHLSGCVDEEFEDTLGNRFFVKKGKNPDFKVMVSAHMSFRNRGVYRSAPRLAVADRAALPKDHPGNPVGKSYVEL